MQNYDAIVINQQTLAHMWGLSSWQGVASPEIPRCGFLLLSNSNWLQLLTYHSHQDSLAHIYRLCKALESSSR